MARTRSMGFNAALTLLLTGLGQALGLFRELLFGATFGTSRAFDIYTAVFGFVLFVASLLSVLPNLAIPALTRLRESGGPGQLAAYVNALLVISLSCTLAVAGIGEVWPKAVAAMIAPGLLSPQSGDPRLFLSLIRLTLPLLTLMALVQVVRSLLNAAMRFGLSSMESLFFNAGIICAVFGASYGLGVTDVRVPIFGIYLAYTVYLAVCVRSVVRQVPLTWKVDLADVRGTLPSAGLLLTGTFFAFVSPLVLMWYASFSGAGTIAALGYAQRATLLSVTSVVNAVMTVFLPAASLMVVKNQRDRLSAQSEKLLRVFGMLSLGAMLLLLLEGRFLIRLLYSRGSFDETSVSLVSGALVGYIPWVAFFPVSALAVRILYANRAYGVIASISFVCLLVTLVAAPVLGGWRGATGFALTASLHMAVYATLLLRAAARRYVDIDFRRVAIKTLPVAASFLLAVGAGRLATQGLALGGPARAAGDVTAVAVVALGWLASMLSLRGLFGRAAKASETEPGEAAANLANENAER